MVDSGTRGARARARRYVERLVREYAALDRAKLPGLKAMVSEAGVSHPVIMQALHEHPLVESIRGSGYRLSGVDSVQNRLVRYRYRQVSDLLRKDIDRKEFGDSSRLPPTAMLAARYGVSRPTMRRALVYLAESGVVEQRGGWSSTRSGESRHHTTIGLVAAGNPDGTISYHSLRTLEMYRALESECASRNIRLEPYGFNLPQRQLYAGDGRRLDPQSLDGKNHIGYVFLAMHISPEPVRARLIRALCANHRPVVAVDELDEGDVIGIRSRNLRCLSFSSSPRCGFRVGAYLIRRNHTTIVYLSPFHRSRWSQNRLAGLQRAARESQKPVRVVPVTASHYRYEEEFIRESAHLSGLMLSAIDTGKESRSAQFDIGIRLKELVARTLMEQNFSQTVHALCRRALGYTAGTVWVAANDATVIEAQTFLRTVSPAIRKRFSLIGFDDAVESLSHRVTSFNFNIPGVTRSVVDAIINPDRSMTRSRGSVFGPIEVEGFITDRGTVKTVHSRGPK